MVLQNMQLNVYFWFKMYVTTTSHLDLLMNINIYKKVFWLGCSSAGEGLPGMLKAQCLVPSTAPKTEMSPRATGKGVKQR